MTIGRIACAVMLTACVVGCEGSDVATGAYATMAEARQYGAIENAWLPKIVPPGAHDIREAHANNASGRWGLFSFPSADADALRGALEQQETSLAGVQCGIPSRIEWWPLLLRGALKPEQIKAAGLNAYRSKDEHLIVIVNWKQGRAYYWRE